MRILSVFHLNDLNTSKDTTKAKFIKFFNDKTALFNNQIITVSLLVWTMADQNTGGTLLNSHVHGKSLVSSAIFICNN